MNTAAPTVVRLPDVGYAPDARPPRWFPAVSSSTNTSKPAAPGRPSWPRETS